MNDFVLNSHQCPLQEQTSSNVGKRGDAKVVQIDVPEARVSEMDVFPVGVFQEGETPMSVVEVCEVGTSNVSVTPERAASATASQPDVTGMEMSEEVGSKEGVPSVETTRELPNVVVSRMEVSAKDTARPFSVASTQSGSDGRPTTGGTLSAGNVITEFSPEWSYCDGKSKVLILGDWSRHSGPYTCLFDGCSVPATLIQPGVLRCFSPPHDQGLVALQVAWNGFIISNACVFEYKKRESAKNSVSDWLGASDADLKKLFLARIERLEGILGISGADTEDEAGAIEREAGTVEDRLVRICEVLLRRPGAGMLQDTERRPKGLTLLHLAAGLGYIKLIRLLQEHEFNSCGTRSEGVKDNTATADVSNQFLEWSPRDNDSFGCTPLMWACWHGHEDAAMTLLAWEPSSYSDCDHSGRSAKAAAQERGHVALVKKMEEFMRGEDM